jgi:hypothetical protein
MLDLDYLCNLYNENYHLIMVDLYLIAHNYLLSQARLLSLDSRELILEFYFSFK